jgi:hypothetical protein
LPPRPDENSTVKMQSTCKADLKVGLYRTTCDIPRATQS